MRFGQCGSKTAPDSDWEDISLRWPFMPAHSGLLVSHMYSSHYLEFCCHIDEDGSNAVCQQIFWHTNQ
ncbi:hypothetical protein KIN20_024778 [Parelaphostrongylus tenuis]|uniref:Uncharacterized protein n=1 Tax=Parelaphostrongylus tenuis TaxID=148309 RepID=A0AAD5QTW6_PARTN|nr:hypothetical protein KIN20_024778 [Parelaphostrongylus tenuis]